MVETWGYLVLNAGKSCLAFLIFFSVCSENVALCVSSIRSVESFLHWHRLYKASCRPLSPQLLYTCNYL